MLFLVFLILALPYVHCTNQQADMPVLLTLYSVLCPSFHDVPANRNSSNLDATGGHFAELNTSYQTDLVDPTTDLPAACQPALGLTFQLKFGNTTNSFQTAGALGSIVVNMTDGLLDAIQSDSADTGLSVSLLVTIPGSFGQLRCYNEILNGDDLETIYGVPNTTSLLYCIAYTVVCPVDCVWGNWSDFDNCSASCGGGIQTRTRDILRPASNGGMECSGNDTETRPCNTDPCPECLYGNWTDFGNCSLDCGGGIQTRTRDLLNLSDTAMNCSAQQTETQPCNTDPCSGCFYLETDWGNCSVPCGGGIQTRIRPLDLNASDPEMNCSDLQTETRSCNNNSCTVPVPMVVPMPAPLPTGSQPPNTCCYRFKNPGLPSFTLPLAQPNSPGDITLNKNNPIVLADGHGINAGQGCNGDDFEYWHESGVWRRDYIDSNGANQNNIDLFYVTDGTSLNIRTIQTTQANIGSVLQRRIARLWITCNNGYYSCIEFTVGGTSQRLAGNENNTNGQCPANITNCQNCDQPSEEVCTFIASLQIESMNDVLMSRNLTLIVNVTVNDDNCSNVFYELENEVDQTYANRLCALIAGQAELDIRRVSCSIVPSVKRAGGFSVALQLNDPIPDTDVDSGGSALSVTLSLLVFGVSYLLF